MSDEKKRYEENVGHPPQNLPKDHPDKWQWEYRGSKADKEGLLARLRGNDPVNIEEDDGPPQDETLW